MGSFAELYSSGKYRELIKACNEVSSEESKYYEISCLWRLGEIDPALVLANKYLNDLDQTQVYFVKLLNRLGTIYIDKGEYGIALDYFGRSLEIANSKSFIFEIANIMINTGIVNRMKGEYDEALNYFRKSMDIYESLGKKKQVAISLNNIALIYRNLGEFDIALEYLIQGDSIFEKIGNILEKVYSKSLMIDLYLLKKDAENFDIHLEELKRLSELETNKIPLVLYKIGKNLRLTLSNRGRDKILALSLLEEVLEEIDFDAQIKIDTTLHVIDLLLTEYQIFKEYEARSKIIHHLEVIFQLSLRQNLLPSLVQTYLLKAKLALVDGKFQEASTQIDIAQKISEDKNLYQLLIEIRKQRDLMVKQYSSIQKMIDENVDWATRVNETKIIDYLYHVKSSINDEKAF